jgi:hypothetical protein
MEGEVDRNDVRRDENGRLWLSPSRRQVLGGLAAAVGAGLGRARAAEGSTLDGVEDLNDSSRVVPSYERRQTGTLQELYVARREEHFPPVRRTPSLAIAVEGGVRMETGSSGTSTSPLLTNLGEIHATSGPPSDVLIEDTPALVCARQGGLRLVVDETPPSPGDVVGGSAVEVNGAETVANLPASPSTPSFEYARQGGLRVNV